MDYVEKALSLGATNAAIIPSEEIVFEKELRKMCEMNTCRKYNTTWTCPPAVGEVEELEKLVKSHPYGLVIQKVHQLEDSFDFEGMQEGNRIYQQMYQKVWDMMRQQHFQKLLPLSAGGCTLCESCTYPYAPCRHPDLAVPSIEACGIYVNKTLEKVHIPYNNGEATVSYAGIIMFQP